MAGAKGTQYSRFLDFHGRNPDILNSIANLSNDEVFTPPEFANRMLDTLAKGWAESNSGEDIWSNSKVTFLDPFTKSGVFLREIATRLIEGLEKEIPDLQARVDHILTKQVFGIATTELTSLMARRSLYCSKKANGKHSVTKKLNTEAGNIWFEPLEHTWVGGKTKVITMDKEGNQIEKALDGRCKFCRAPRREFDRDDGLELHAYGLIHNDDPKKWVQEIFGGDMLFDVIIGNPPYQLAGGAGGTSDSSIYHKFVEQAQKLDPKLLCMVTPSRWLAGGRGMDSFRNSMLSEGKLRALVDYPVSSEVFPGVEVKGGISYFLWDPAFGGSVKYSMNRGDELEGPESRDLGEFDVFVRSTTAVEILRKVQARSEKSIISILTADTPFGIATNFTDYRRLAAPEDITLHFISKAKRESAFVPRLSIKKNADLIDSWKVLVPKAGSDGGQKIPDIVLGKAKIVGPPSVCSQSYLAFWLPSEIQARGLQSYYQTKFFRFLVSLRKITQDALRGTYEWVPMQDFTNILNDSDLYKKYELSQKEIDYLEKAIRPMELDNG